MFGNKGQGSLEYLLLIGGAVLVAAIVIALVITSAGTAGTDVTANMDSANLKAAAAQCNGRALATPTPIIQIGGINYYCCTRAAVTPYTGATATVQAGNGTTVANCVSG